jgi:hypothetical protein
MPLPPFTSFEPRARVAAGCEARGRGHCHRPELFCSEVASALAKYVGAGDLTLDLAINRLEECLGLADALIPERSLVSEALAAAAKHRHR